jgi:hypothetical protein
MACALRYSLLFSGLSMMFVNFSAIPDIPRMSLAVAASLLVHLLFLACFVSQPGFAGKGEGHGAALKIRLSAVSGNKVAAGLSMAAEEAIPVVLFPPASIPMESALPRSGEESETVDLPPVKDESFFPRSRLSVPPVRVADSAIDDLLSRFGERLAQGTYFLRLFIDRNGEVVDVQGRISRDGEDSENSDLVFEQLMAAFKSIRFLPAEINGHAVNSQVEFEINAVDVPAGSSNASGRPGIKSTRRKGALM